MRSNDDHTEKRASGTDASDRTVWAKKWRLSDSKSLLMKAGKNHTLLASSITAATGFFNAVRTEKKVRQVVLAMSATTTVSVIADVGYFQILVVIFSWVLALICEIFNTALEKVLDYASGKEYHPLVRDGKDYAAACTFVSILFASSLSLFVIIDRIF